MKRTLVFGMGLALYLAGTTDVFSAPGNDDFANSAVLSGFGTVSGSNVDATEEAGEPDHAGSPGGASVWWVWTPLSDVSVALDTFGSDFDTLLAVYEGPDVSNLTEVASNDDAGSDSQSRVTFDAVSGTVYRIAVDGYDGEDGSIMLTLSGVVAPPNDDFADATVLPGFGTLLGTNVGATAEAGEPDHAGATGGTSLWWVWTAPSNVAVALDTFGSDFDTLLAVYVGPDVSNLAAVVSNDQAGGDQSRVTFDAVSGTVYRIAVDGYGGATGAISLTLAKRFPPPNDAFANAITIPGCETVRGTNMDATVEAGEPHHAGATGGASLWWVWTASSNATVDLDTLDSNFDTLLAVYVGSELTNLTEVASNDDVSEYISQSQLRFDAVSGTVYRIVVDGPPGEVGEAVLRLGCRPPAAVNDDFADATPIVGFGLFLGDNTMATKEAGEPDHAGDPGGASIWWRWTSPSNGTVFADTMDCTFDTVLAVYTGTDVSNLTGVASNDDVVDTVEQSRVRFQAVLGTTYHIAVDGHFGAGGAVKLNVRFANVPSNDDFASATSIPGFGTYEANNVDATREPNEPSHAEVGWTSVWWDWQATTDGPVVLDTFGSDFDTLLAVYVGTNLSNLSSVVSNDDHSGSLQSEVRFGATSGTVYRIAVDGKGKACGNVSLKFSSGSSDADGDGLPDVWETAYFGSPANADGDGNPDGDVPSNYEEYVAGTDPTNGASFLAVTNGWIDASGHAILEWNAVAGRLYRLQWSTNLTVGFETLPGQVSYPSHRFTNSASAEAKYYRVEVSLPPE